MVVPRHSLPQRAQGKAVDARADLFSLGVVLWECATGKRLWDAGAFDFIDQIVNTPAPPLDASLAPIAPLVAQLLEKDRERRPASASDVAAQLRAHAAPRESIAKLVQSLGIPSLKK